MSQNRAFLKYQPVTTIASQINKIFFSSFLLSHRISGFVQGEKIKLFIAKFLMCVYRLYLETSSCLVLIGRRHIKASLQSSNKT